MDAQLKKGLLDVAVLGALAQGDSYGYRIIRTLKPFVHISESTLYPILKRLEKGDLAHCYQQPHAGRLRKYYHLTDAGAARIQEFLLEWDELQSIHNFVAQAAGPPALPPPTPNCDHTTD